MTHAQHVNLIQGGITNSGGNWADLGSGWGAFTLALRDCAGPTVSIFSIDLDKKNLELQKENFHQMFPSADISYMVADFTKELDLPLLDGILMANSLHFIKDQVELLRKLKNYLGPGGKLLIVEYNSDIGNSWVPYPFSFKNFKKLAESAGFKNIQLVNSISSSWMDEMYCAECFA